MTNCTATGCMEFELSWSTAHLSHVAARSLLTPWFELICSESRTGPNSSEL